MIIVEYLTKSETKKFLQRAGLFLSVLGFFLTETFRGLSSLGIIILVSLALIEFIQRKFPFRLLLSSPYFTPFIIAFFMLLLTLTYTTPENFNDINLYAEKRLVFLVFPFAFIILPSFEPKYYKELYLFFFLVMLVATIPSTCYYFSNKEEIVKQYLQSGILPTPINHVRFSLLICYAIFLGFYLTIIDKYINKIIRTFILIPGILFLIFYLHLLAVRSGLAAFYAICALGLIYLLIKKKFVLALPIIIILPVILFLAIKHLDTLSARIGYTLYDIDQFAVKESANNYSLSRRVVSNKVALTVFENNIFFGTGEANLEKELHKVYEKDFPYIKKENYLSPHNQYLTILAGTGIFGFIIFFGCFYFPLFYNKNYLYFPLICIYVILTVSFFAEDTLQTHLGFLFASFFIMVNLHYLKSNPPIK